ncbi:MAG TPA: hypothetical protein VF845_10095 [Terriglobales bacterium]
MKRTLVLIGIMALALATAPRVVAQSPKPFCAKGAMLVGTWAWQTMLPVAPGQQLPLPAVVTYHRDGTVTGADGMMLGGLPVNPFRYTPLLGAWERTGQHSFRGTALFLRFDAATGTLVAIIRTRSHIEFGIDSDHIQGTMHADFLSCSTPLTCPEPTSAPLELWQPYGPVSDFSFMASRLHIVPIPE